MVSKREDAVPTRSTDQDRDRVVEVLNEAYARGALSEPEREQRVARAWGAQHAGQLAALTADLPEPAPAEHAQQDRWRDWRDWLREWQWWLGGAVIMTAVWGVQVLRSGLRFYWPVAPLGIWAAVLVAIAIWPRSTASDGDRRD